MTLGVVVGNPKVRSRTLDVAMSVAHAAAHVAELGDRDELVTDLAEMGSQRGAVVVGHRRHLTRCQNQALHY